jgi:Type IV secretion-system coupling protein DNA-binding domain
MLPFPIGQTENYKQRITISSEAQMRNAAIFGEPGTGKTTLLRNMILWDVREGEGAALADPHGDLIDDILNNIPRSRINDVIYFNPLDENYSIAINPLQYTRENQRRLVVPYLVSILKNIWSEFWGPQTEFILSSLLSALLEQKQPISFLALLRALIDDEYRSYIGKQVSDPVVTLCLQMYSEEWSQRFRTEASAAPLNKIAKLIADPLLRAVLGQPRSSFNFRRIMDTRKILLCNLPIGELGEDVSSLLGSVIVTMTFLAAVSRADIPKEKRIPFKFYADEVQNFIHGVNLPAMLTAGRKYKLSFIIVAQTTDQLPSNSLSTVLGTCETKIAFRVDPVDAEKLSLRFGQPISASSLRELPDYRAAVRTLTLLNEKSSALIPGTPHLINVYPPFAIETNKAERDAVIEASRQRYARLRSDIEKKHKRFLARKATQLKG